MTAALLAAALAFVPAAGRAERASPARVGRVIVVGNARTPDRLILRRLDFSPGQPLPGEAGLLRAEIRLLTAFPKRFDLAAGDRPTVAVVVVVHRDSGFADIEVRFPEKPARGR